jgi:hypothetical protein
MSLLKLDPDFEPAFDGPKMAQDLIYKIPKELPISKAYLFGSAAVAKNTPDSDLDIFLVVPDHLDIKSYYKFVNAPFFSIVAVDWIIKSQTEFESLKLIGGISMIASQNGIELKTNGSI